MPSEGHSNVNSLAELAIARVNSLLGGRNTSMEARTCHPVCSEKNRKRKLFAIGLAIRLVGVGLIWLGVGHDSLFRKGLVVLGVILSIGGITVLRYLLMSGPLSKLSGLLSKKSSSKDRSA